MNLLKAVGVTASILIGAIVILAIVGDTGVARALVASILLGSSIWASLDSVRFKEYQTGLPGPLVLFIGFVILWIFYFPGYLAKRYAIQAGQIPLKKRYRVGAAVSARADQ